MYYLVYDPIDNTYVQLRTTKDDVIIQNTKWSNNYKIHAHLWDIALADKNGFYSCTSGDTFHVWFPTTKYTLLLTSTTPITSTSHPELSI